MKPRKHLSVAKLATVGAARTAPRMAHRLYGCSRRQTSSRRVIMAKLPARARFRAASASITASRGEPAREKLAVSPARSIKLFETKSGLDITQRVIELLWLASEQGYLTFEVVHQTFAGSDLSPDDMAAVYGAQGQAGVELVDALPVESVQSPTHAAAAESVYLNTQSASVQNTLQQAGAAQLLSLDAQATLSRQMEDADHEMRQIFYGFGFAAHEHIAQAEQILAHSSEESFERSVAAPELRGSLQYLQALPDLIKQTRALDKKAAVAYREWRQALGQPNAEEYRQEFRKLDRMLQQTFPKFHYQAKVVQKMIAPAQSIAAAFQASQRGLLQVRRCGDSVCQMPLVDVERQTIERMEEFVRLPCEMFLRNYTQLMAAETRFRRARCQLIQGHLYLVASMARTYSNRGHTLPQLIREGILGLIRAVENFEHRREWKFTTHAAWWIRQSIRASLPYPLRHASKPASLVVGDKDVSAK
jgi:RNA polymerase primary sigma factor